MTRSRRAGRMPEPPILEVQSITSLDQKSTRSQFAGHPTIRLHEPPGPCLSGPAVRARLRSMDLVRGAVMILMAIDHVRVYSGLPAGGPTPHFFHALDHALLRAGLHLSRRYQHFSLRPETRRCFALPGHPRAVAHPAGTHISSVAWTFNFDFRHYEMAGVIWVIGVCMILMGGLVEAAADCRRRDRPGHRCCPQPDGSHMGKLLEGMDANRSPASGRFCTSDFSPGPIQFGPDGPT